MSEQKKGWLANLEEALKPHWDWLDSQYVAFPHHVTIPAETYEELWHSGYFEGTETFIWQPDEDYVVMDENHGDTNTVCFNDLSKALLFKLTHGGSQ